MAPPGRSHISFILLKRAVILSHITSANSQLNLTFESSKVMLLGILVTAIKIKFCFFFFKRCGRREEEGGKGFGGILLNKNGVFLVYQLFTSETELQKRTILQ